MVNYFKKISHCVRHSCRLDKIYIISKGLGNYTEAKINNIMY